MTNETRTVQAVFKEITGRVYPQKNAEQPCIAAAPDLGGFISGGRGSNRAVSPNREPELPKNPVLTV